MSHYNLFYFKLSWQQAFYAGVNRVQNCLAAENSFVKTACETLVKCTKYADITEAD